MISTSANFSLHDCFVLKDFYSQLYIFLTDSHESRRVLSVTLRLTLVQSILVPCLLPVLAFRYVPVSCHCRITTRHIGLQLGLSLRLKLVRIDQLVFLTCCLYLSDEKMLSHGLNMSVAATTLCRIY